MKFYLSSISSISYIAKQWRNHSYLFHLTTGIVFWLISLFLFTVPGHAQIICGGITVNSSCLSNPTQTFVCIEGEVQSHTLYGTELLFPTQAATTPQFLVVKGNLLITDHYTFAPGSEIIFVDGTSGFEIIANKTLTISDSHLHGCDALWRGVELRSGTLLANGNTFEDAKAAIIVRDGNTVDIQSNTFDKNAVGLLCTPSNPSAVGSSIFLATNKGISGNVFKGGNMMLEAIDPIDVDPGVGQTNLQDGALSYPFGGVWVDRMLSFKLNSNTFENFGNVLEGSSYAIQNAAVFSHRTNIDIFDCIFTDIGHYDPTNTDDTSTGIAIYGKNNMDNAVTQTIVVNGTFTNCTRDIWTRGTHLDVTGITSTKTVEGIRAGMNSSLQAQLNVNVKGNTINFFRGFGIKVEQLRPISINIEDNILTDNNELYDPALRIGIWIKGFDDAPVEGSWIHNNEINSNSGSFNGGLIGIALDNVHDMVVVENTIDALGAELSTFMGIRNLGPPSNGARLFENTITGRGINYPDPSAGIFFNESVNTWIRCNNTGDVNSGHIYLGNCDNADIYQNYFNQHTIGLSLGSPDFSSDMNVVGAQRGKQNVWNGFNSPIEAFALNEASATSSVFQVKTGGVIGSIFMPDPRKIGPDDDNGMWFFDVSGMPVQTTACHCYGCKVKLADSDYQIIDDTYVPPFDYPALDWEARYHFSDRLYQNPELQTESPEVIQYYQDTYNNSYSQLNRIRRDFQTIWQSDNSLVTNVANLRAALQTALDQRFALNDQLTENLEDNTSLHAQMAIADINVENAANALSIAVTSLNAWVNQSVNTMLTDLGNLSFLETYEQDMQAVIETMLQTHFTDGVLTAQQVADMTAIADKCRFEGGYAVVLARVFFEPQDSYPQDTEDCSLSGRSNNSLPDTVKVVENTIYPNPVNSLLTLNLDQPYNNGMARIYNNQGVLIKSVKFNGKIMQLSVVNLIAGFYTLEVQLDGQPAFNKTFVKID